MTVDGRIEQGIQSERITAPIEKKGLKEKKNVNNVKGGYKGKNKNF